MRSTVMCGECGSRPTTYTKPNWTGDRQGQRRDHDLCRRCWKKLMDGVRAERLQEESSDAHAVPVRVVGVELD